MKTALVIFGCIVAVLVLIYAYYGGFKRIVVQTAVQGGEFVVYDTIVGDYRQSGMVMDQIYYALLNDHKVETFKGYGQYFDNPKTTEKSILRSEAGCIIEAKDVDKVRDLDQFKSKYLPERNAMIAEFPYKGKLSVLFSIMKVYPALNKYAKSKGFNDAGPVIEIYDIPKKKIFYRQALVKE